MPNTPSDPGTQNLAEQLACMNMDAVILTPPDKRKPDDCPDCSRNQSSGKPITWQDWEAGSRS